MLSSVLLLLCEKRGSICVGALNQLGVWRRVVCCFCSGVKEGQQTPLRTDWSGHSRIFFFFGSIQVNALKLSSVHSCHFYLGFTLLLYFHNIKWHLKKCFSIVGWVFLGPGCLSLMPHISVLCCIYTSVYPQTSWHIHLHTSTHAPLYPHFITHHNFSSSASASLLSLLNDRQQKI